MTGRAGSAGRGPGRPGPRRPRPAARARVEPRARRVLPRVCLHDRSRSPPRSRGPVPALRVRSAGGGRVRRRAPAGPGRCRPPRRGRRPGRLGRDTSIGPRPCSIAFAIRLRVACASRRRSPQTLAEGPDQISSSSTPGQVRSISIESASSSATLTSSHPRTGRLGRPTSRRSSSASAARPSSRSIARNRAGDSSAVRAPSCSPSRAAVTGPRSS